MSTEAVLLRQRDRQYIEACEQAGIEPELARGREYPKTVVLPVVDRGRRVGDSCQPLRTVDVIRWAVDFAESEVGVDSRKTLFTTQIFLFLVQVRNGSQMIHRAAAVLIEAGMTLQDVRALWPNQITASPLRKARKDLHHLRSEKA